MILYPRSLLDLFQGARDTLTFIELRQCTLEKGKPLKSIGVSLPQLKHLKIMFSGHTMWPLLWSIQDVSSDAELELTIEQDTLRDLTSNPEFREVFLPLEFSRAREHYSGVTFYERNGSSRPRFTAVVHVGGYMPKPLSYIFFDRAALLNEVLETIQLEDFCSLPCPASADLPMDVLPPTQTIEVFSRCAGRALSWLALHAMHEVITPLHTIIFNDVTLPNRDLPPAPRSDGAVDRFAADRVELRNKILPNIEMFLHARSVAGHPVRVIFRCLEYEAQVVESLRPIAKELVIESSCRLTPTPGGNA